jgi:hypothetical protein
MVEDYPSAEQMATAARDRVVKEFRLSAAIDRYAALYERLGSRT